MVSMGAAMRRSKTGLEPIRERVTRIESFVYWFDPVSSVGPLRGPTHRHPTAPLCLCDSGATYVVGSFGGNR